MPPRHVVRQLMLASIGLVTKTQCVPGQLEDILVADKQLAKELLYDMKQAELAQQAAAQAVIADDARQAAVPLAGAASTPGNQIMGPSPQSGAHHTRPNARGFDIICCIMGPCRAGS